MKKKILSILALLVMAITALTFGACGGGGGGETLTLDVSVKSIKPYQIFTITATYSGEEEVTWSTSNSAIATVENGTVTGVAPGEATITASAGEETAECYVTVEVDNEVPVVNVTNVTDNQLTINSNDTFDLEVEITFDGEERPAELNFSSSDSEVATVSSTGTITAVDEGECEIVITGSWRNFDEQQINATISLTVVKDVQFSLSCETVELYTLAELDGDSYANSATLIPSLSINGDQITSGFTFESADSDVVAVDADGVVTSVSAGETTVTCSYVDGDGDTHTVEKTFTVTYVIKDKVLDEVMLVELSKNPTTDDIKSVFAGGETITKIEDVTGASPTEITITSGAIDVATATTGERTWRIYNDAYAYNVKLTVVDIIIDDATELKATFVSHKYNSANEGAKYIVLGADIENVGNYSGWGNRFSGVFDGLGHVISGINITAWGLLGIAEEGAIIRNLGLTGVTLCEQGGALMSMAYSVTVDNVYVEIIQSNHTATNATGGVVGQIESNAFTIKNSVIKMNGVTKDSNAGVLGGTWGAGTGASVENSYFISEGYPYGKALGSASNSKGLSENEKGEWAYVYETDADALEVFDGTIPVGFNTDLWKMDKFGNVTFGNSLVFDNAQKLTGNKNNGELFYFSKDVTTYCTDYANTLVDGGYYLITLPQSVSTVEKVKLANTEITDFAYSNGVLKIAISEVATLGNGEIQVSIETDNAAYSARATIADFVITTDKEFYNVIREPANVASGKYVILGNDITYTQAAYTRKVTGGFTLGGTIDGKGYCVDSFTINDIAMFTAFSYGTVKNIAFTNLSHINTRGLGGIFGYEAANFTIDNVYVEVTNYAGIGGCLIHNLVGGTNNNIKNTVVVDKTGSVNIGTVAAKYASGKTINFSNCYFIGNEKPFNTGTATDPVYSTAATYNYADTSAAVTSMNGILPSDFNNCWSLNDGVFKFGSATINQVTE